MSMQLKPLAKSYSDPIEFALAKQAPQTRSSRGCTAFRELVALRYKFIGTREIVWISTRTNRPQKPQTVKTRAECRASDLFAALEDFKRQQLESINKDQSFVATLFGTVYAIAADGRIVGEYSGIGVSLSNAGRLNTGV